MTKSPFISTSTMGSMNIGIFIIIIVLLSSAAAAGNVFRMAVDEVEDNGAIQSSIPKDAPVKFAFAKHFQDHMVLQRAPQQANIYGFSPDIGAKIVLRVTDSDSGEVFDYETVAKQGPRPDVGVWMVTLKPFDADTTVSIRAESERGVLNLEDVIFGDVWICSGQSNMEFTVSMMLRAKEELEEAHLYPKIRVFSAGENVSTTPLVDLLDVLEKWSKPSNASLGGKAWTYFSAVCWLYGKNIHKALGIPIGLVDTNWGGTPVEAWSSPDALAQCNLSTTDHQMSSKMLPTTHGEPFVGGPQNNSVLWNAMIVPFLPMTIYGAIWYQGEADRYHPKVDRYACTFPAMIDDWRAKFHDASQGQTSSNFPFGFVQLSANVPDPSIDFGLPNIRWHQTANYGYVPNPRMQNVFMAVAMDLPGFKSKFSPIHPQDKTDVGFRLSLSGLQYAYDKTEICQGPFPTTATIKGAELVITYTSVVKLDIRDWTGFDLLCATEGGQSDGAKEWRPTSIIAHTNTTISLYLDICPTGQEVKGVRYAWRESPCEFKKCAVYGSVNDLPGPPFVADIQRDAKGQATVDFSGPTRI